MKFPLFAKAIVPNAGEPKGFGEINAEIRCAGQYVRPGDWIIGDESGVVVVPQERAYEIARQGARGAEERGADPRGDPAGEHPLGSGRTDKVGKKVGSFQWNTERSSRVAPEFLIFFIASSTWSTRRMRTAPSLPE